MAAFRFRLQPVLDQREREERQRELELAEIDRERLALEGAIRGCGLRLRGMTQDLRELLSPGAGSGSVRGASWQAGASMRELSEAQRLAIELAGVHRRLEAAHAALVEASVRRRAMESLRDRRREEWADGIRSAEERELDDVSMAMWRRNAEGSA